MSEACLEGEKQNQNHQGNRIEHEPNIPLGAIHFKAQVISSCKWQGRTCERAVYFSFSSSK